MGFVDARTLPAGHRIRADLCIVGSGAAGLAIASRFLGGPRRVAVLESGGLEFDPQIQSLAEGRVVGEPDAPLHQSRLRLFGGTTNHWTAHVRPLGPMDFEPRPWVPESGWPFRFATVAPYYDKAKAFFDLPADAFDVDAWARTVAAPPWRFEDGRVESHVFRVLPLGKRLLGVRLREPIARSANVTVYLHANVLEVRTAEGGDRVRDVRVQAFEGPALTARARDFVLAAGGIENARILLLSAGAQGRQLANRHDLVGRYFANHLEAKVVAEMRPTAPDLPLGFYQGTLRPLAGHGVLVLAAGTQRDARVLNCQFNVRRSPVSAPTAGHPTGLGPHVGEVARQMDGAPPAPAEARGEKTVGDPTLVLLATAEQSPNRESRVRLGDKLDRLGQPEAVLDWRLTAADSRSVGLSVYALAQALGAAGLGRLRRLFPEAGFRFVDPRGSFHHMGTTRMHDDPRRGVVDADCRVHGVGNLFVAGSSVFPTYGTVNPTFTIAALALRLADHLERRLT